MARGAAEADDIAVAEVGAGGRKQSVIEARGPLGVAEDGADLDEQGRAGTTLALTHI